MTLCLSAEPTHISGTLILSEKLTRLVLNFITNKVMGETQRAWMREMCEMEICLKIVMRGIRHLIMIERKGWPYRRSQMLSLCVKIMVSLMHIVTQHITKYALTLSSHKPLRGLAIFLSKFSSKSSCTDTKQWVSHLRLITHTE